MKIFKFGNSSLVKFSKHNKVNIVYYDLKFGLLRFDCLEEKKRELKISDLNYYVILIF